ncbi:MAG: aspartate/glutamate racemase family protein [Clostridia bacterium]
MLTLGIIGGMGPEATQVMYREIIERTDAVRDQDHIDIIIYSHASMPDRTEAIKEGRTKEIAGLLSRDAEMLCHCGAGAIAIPCNTSHRFIEDIQRAVDVPVINMIEETAEYIKNSRPRVKKVGILATDGTLKSGLYRRALESRGLEPFEPDEEIQKIVMSIIYDQIKAGQKGSREDFSAVDCFLKKNGCDGAILACTELSVFRANHELDSFYVDAMRVLVDKCISLCGGKLKK